MPLNILNKTIYEFRDYLFLGKFLTLYYACINRSSPFMFKACPPTILNDNTPLECKRSTDKTILFWTLNSSRITWNISTVSTEENFGCFFFPAEHLSTKANFSRKLMHVHQQFPDSAWPRPWRLGTCGTGHQYARLIIGRRPRKPITIAAPRGASPPPSGRLPRVAVPVVLHDHDSSYSSILLSHI